MSDQAKLAHIKDLWRSVGIKAVSSVHILKAFSELNKHIYLVGSTKQAEDFFNKDN